jgi:hypothetical protein
MYGFSRVGRKVQGLPIAVDVRTVGLEKKARNSRQAQPTGSLKEYATMTTISPVSSYRNDTWQTLDRDEDSNLTLNRARKDAGMTCDTSLAGSDPTYRETKVAQQDWVHAAIEGGKHVTPDVISHVLIEVAQHAKGEGPWLRAASVSLPVAAIIGLYEGAKMIEHSHQKGDALERALSRDAARGGMLLALELPGGYTLSELSKIPESSTGPRGSLNGSNADAIATAIRSNQAHTALLQLHADRGMNTARKLLDAGALVAGASTNQVKTALLAEPAALQAYETDPAFRAGCDSLIWARSHDPKAYTETVTALDERDVRYQQHHLRVGA